MGSAEEDVGVLSGSEEFTFLSLYPVPGSPTGWEVASPLEQRFKDDREES